MKLALLLFGLSKYEYYNINLKKYIEIDYRKSIDNYRSHIFTYFENKGYDIDVYFATNNMNEEDKKEIKHLYNPIDCDFMDNMVNYRVSRNSKVERVIKLCLDSNITYDTVLITRFDLIFNKKFESCNINLNKFNLVSTLKDTNLICDNFYLFPFNILDNFYSIVKMNRTNNFHAIKRILEKINGRDYINYILDEQVKIGGLSFYTIVRNII